MLDTGCTRTCFRFGENFLRGIQTSSTNSQILCANSQMMPTAGSVKLALQFSPNFKPTADALIIKDLSAAAIIGLDVIHDLTITKNSKFVLVNGNKLSLCADSNNPKVCYTTNKLHLAPLSETMVQLKNPLKDTSYQFVAIDALRKQKFCDAITIAPSINNNSEFVTLLIANSSNQTQYIPKRTPICTIEYAQITSLNAVSEVSDTVQESIRVEDFQSCRLKLANQKGFSPQIGSIGDIGEKRKTELREIVDRFRLAFSMGEGDIGKLGYFRFTLPLLDERETAHQPPRPVPMHLKEKVDKEIGNWLELGIIEETQSGFNIPLIILKKSDGSIRVSLDARQLNTKLKPDRFPLPHLSDTLSTIGAKLSQGNECYVSTFDFARGYWQVQVEDRDQHKLAFSHRQKHYSAKRMLYGCSTAPSCFSRIMNRLFGDHPSFLLYLDDLIIIDNDYKAHLQSLEFLFRTCIKFGILLSAKKCHLAESTIQFLGHNIDKSGIKPLQKHIDAINAFPRPTNKQEVKRLLGMVNFNLKFVEGGSICLQPLYDICSIKKDFIWTETQERAFTEIKQKLQNAKGLRHRNPKLPLVLVSDASLFGAGATLYQQRKDELEVIGYFSRSFSSADQKRSMRAKELIALTLAIRHFEFFLIGTTFSCVSDHRSLLYLYREHMKTTLDLKLTNIFIYLQQFDFRIFYSPGSAPIMASADCLSRLPKFTLDELSKKCDDNNIPDKVFALLHTPAAEISTPMKTYLRALAKGNETQPPIPDTESTDAQTILLKFNDYIFDAKTIEERQRKCETLTAIFKRLEAGSKTACKKFRIDDNILFNITKDMKRIVLPFDIAKEFLKYCHTSYGHAGSKQLMKIVSKTVFIPKIEELSYDVTRLCIDCLRVKPRKMIRPSLIEKRTFECQPWAKTSVDIWDLGKTDRRGKRYLLTAVDHLTGFLECRALSKKTQSQTSEAMLSIILQHGLTTKVITDNGLEFSMNFSDVLERFRIVHVKTSAYMSMSNSKVERTHRELNQKLKLLDVKRSNWSEHYEYIKFLINNLPKSNNDNLSAAECLYGRALHVPFEVLQPVENTTEPYTKALNWYLTELHPSLMAYQFNKYAKMLEKDGEKKTPILKVGDYCLIWKPILDQGKLSKNWDGPYRVVRRYSKHSYKLVCDTTKRSFRRNIRHLRPLSKHNSTEKQEETLIQTTNAHDQRKTENRDTNPETYEDEFQNRRDFLALPFGLHSA